MTKLPIFDGHNDTLTQLLNIEKSRGRSFFQESGFGHIDLPRARRAGMFGGFFAIWTPPPEDSPERDEMFGFHKTADGYEVVMQSRQEQGRSEKFTDDVIAFANRLERNSAGQVKLVREYDELVDCLAGDRFAVIIHLEGAEAIREDLANLEKYYERGVRSLGVAWSRPNAFGEGVPYRFPHSPDTGPGLTGAGKRLVARCNELGILVDLAHLNEKGFYDAAEVSSKPLVVSHTAVHSLSASTRNLTDAQIDTVGESGGVIGIWYEPVNVRGDGSMARDLSIAQIVRHFVYIAERIGVEHVAFGSDFDGATMPEVMKDVSCYPDLVAGLKEAGFEREELEKIAYKNWLRVIEATWR